MANTSPDESVDTNPLQKLIALARELGAIEVVTLHGSAGAQLLFDLPYLTTNPRILKERLEEAGAGVTVVVVCFIPDDAIETGGSDGPTREG